MTRARGRKLGNANATTRTSQSRMTHHRHRGATDPCCGRTRTRGRRRGAYSDPEAVRTAVRWAMQLGSHDAKWRWISWGSAFAANTWVIMSLLFSWYVANFGS